MRNRRQKRIDDFNFLYNNANNIFNEFANKDKSHPYFQKHYMLHIVPGSRNGANNPKVVEIFYGQRPFSFITQGRRWTSQTEYGATLLYQQHDNGFVTVVFNPATTSNLKQKEDYIAYSFTGKTNKIRKKRILKKHFKRFIAYMEVSSLDGAPNIWQRFLVWRMRFFCPMIIDKSFNESKFKSFSLEVLKWVITVGLSGFLIYFFTRSDTNYNKQKLEIIIQKDSLQTNKLDKNYNLLITNQDSIEQIKDKLEKQKKIYDQRNIKLLNDLKTNVNRLEKKIDKIESTKR